MLQAIPAKVRIFNLKRQEKQGDKTVIENVASQDFDVASDFFLKNLGKLLGDNGMILREPNAQFESQ